MSGVHAVALLAEPEDEGALVLAINAHSDEIRVVRRCADLAEVRAAAKGRVADLAVVDALNADLDARIIEDLHSEGMGVVLLAPDYLRDSLHSLGADYLIARSNTDQVVDALLLLARTGPVTTADITSARVPAPTDETLGDIASPHEGDDPVQDATVLAVWGTSGAPGRSSIALGLAGELARRASTLLIDADIANPSIAHMLGLPVDVSSVSALARQADRSGLDDRAIDSATLRPMPNLGILTGITSAHRWREIGPASLSAIISASRRRARWIVIDLASVGLDPVAEDIRHHGERDDITAAALRAADEILCVLRADVIGLNRLAPTTEWLQALRRDAVPRMIVNRVDSASVGPGPQLALKEALSPLIPDTLVSLVPEDPFVRTSLLRARAITDFAPSSPAGTALAEIVDLVAGPAPSPQRRRRRGRANVPH